MTKYKINAEIVLNNDGKDVLTLKTKHYKQNLVIMEKRTFDALVKDFNITFDDAGLKK